MITPLPAGTYRLTDGFGWREAVYDKNGKLIAPAGGHTGQDYAAPKGTHILAATDGVIKRSWWDVYKTGGAAGGWMVEVEGSEYVTRYAHMLNSTTRALGSRVKAGDTIGYVGMTGAAKGYHLHFEVLLNGTFIDPLSVIGKQQTPENKDEEMKYFMMYLENGGGNGNHLYGVFSPDCGYFTQFTGQSTANAWIRQLGHTQAFAVNSAYFNQIKEDMAQRRTAIIG